MSGLPLANLSRSQAQVGVGLLAPLQVDPSTRDLATVVGLGSVKQNILAILRANVGETEGMEDFGTRLNQLFLEAPTLGLMDIIPGEIRESLARYEPRVTDVEVAVRDHDEDNGTAYLEIVVSWRLRRTVGVEALGSLTLRRTLDKTGGQPTGWQVVA